MNSAKSSLTSIRGCAVQRSGLVRSRGEPLGAALACLVLAGTALSQEEAGATARIQAALDRAGFGVGFVDDRPGARTDGALSDYCRARGLTRTEGRETLAADGESQQIYILTDADLQQLGRAPTDWVEASQVPSMAYQTLQELLSERFHVSERYLEVLNPAVTNWDATLAGGALYVPRVRAASWHPRAAFVEVDCAAFRLRAMDSNGLILASFPCSIAMDPRRIPSGEMRVAAFAPNPDYTFDPVNFPESARAREIGRKLIIPPGPNNPVGVYWISLSRSGYGIHGTHSPRTIGRPESHGCFRLTNWDIVTLAGMIRAGTPVRVRRGEAVNSEQ